MTDEETLDGDPCTSLSHEDSELVRVNIDSQGKKWKIVCLGCLRDKVDGETDAE